MSDRLQDLFRQRQLVQEQLAWLDREIANASGDPLRSSPATLPPADFPQPTPPPTNFVATQAAAIARHAAADRATRSRAPDSAESPPVTASADAILDQYRVQPDSLKTNVRQGCLIYFFVALAAVAVVVAGLYYALRK
jgi:hypothetical protein